MYKRGFNLLLIVAITPDFQLGRATDTTQTESPDENHADEIFYKRRRPHSTHISYVVDTEHEITKPNNSIQCKSIIAIGKTAFWADDHESSRNADITSHTDEEFVCERDDGSDVPIRGTSQQIQDLRELLNNGTLISAESTIEVVYQEEVTKSIVSSDQIPTKHVTLPPGEVNLKQPQQRRYQRLKYEGEKPVLAVRVVDKDGLVVGDDAKTISDKIFGTYGDTTTMKSQYAACSFGKLQITSQTTRSIQRILAAPGVLEVNIGISITSADQSSIRGAVYEAAGKKLGFALPGPFQHVMFILEGCYKDCGWAAYAYVNSWLSVYQGPFYKFPGVQMHELGHNLNLAHSGGIDKETYTDHSCLMGNPLYSDSIVKMCYNQAKNFQLAQAGAWYSKDHIIIYDSSKRGVSNWSGRLIGVAEYDINQANHPIVIKLVTGTSRDIFVGFNRAVGPNSDNQQASDAVIITEAGNGFEYSQSYIKALIASGHDKTFPNWRGSPHTLKIIVHEINASTFPGYADITITLGSQTNNPTRNPTLQPSKRPSLSPDISYYPTLALPTYSPTFLPTIAEEGSLQTGDTNTANKSVKGIMFLVKAKSDITIRAFDLYARRNVLSTVTIYTKDGDYKVESSRSGWDIAFQDTLKLSRVTTSLEGLSVTIAAGKTQSFFVYVDAGMRIKTTAKAGQLHNQDDALFIYSGTAFRREFYNVVGSGQFSGTIKYDMA